MASIHCSSELMTNYFSAAAVPATSLATVWDPATRQPVVFTLSGGEYPQLESTKTNAAGRRNKNSLNDRIGIPSDARIQAFGLRQDSSFTVYLVLATRNEDGRSELWVLQPFEISDELDLQILGRTRTGSVHGIRVGMTDVPGRQYPTVWVLSQPITRTTSGSDVGRLEVNVRDSSMVIWKDLSLPMNVQNILDIAPSSFGAFGQGLYFFYENQGNKGLLAKFVRPGDEPGDGGKWAQFRMQCPANATSIASFTDFNSKSRNSALVLGADDGLHYYPSHSTGDNPAPILLTKANCFAGAKDLCIAQDKNELAIWARNHRDELGYLVGSIENLKISRTATLLGPGRATAFDSLICRKEWHGSSVQTLLATDASGNLTMLQQSLDTGIWREEPFYVEADGDLVPVRSYTVHIKAIDDKGIPVRNGQVKLKSSSVQSVTVHGSLETLSALGTWCELDLQGELVLIAQTPGVTIQPLEVIGVKTLTGEETAITGESLIDPSKKVVDRLSGLTSEDGLKSATMPGGEKSLWYGQEQPSDADLKMAAQCFQAIADGHAALPSNGSTVKPASAPAGEVRIMASGAFDEVREFVMDGFHYIKEKIVEVKEWVVRQADNVWEFACRLGKELKIFVLDCVEKVTEAASWVWEKMKLGWEKLCEFAGFLFSWEDILDTKTSIKGMINAGFDFAAVQIESVNSKIESFFDDLEEKLGKAIDIAGKQEASPVSSRDYQSDPEMTDAKDSPVTKWIGERLRNGNRSMTAKAPNDPAQIDLFQDRVVPLIMSVVDLVETLTKDIQDLFKAQDSMIMDQMLKKTGGNFMAKALAIVKDTLKLIVTSVAKLVLLLKDLANAELTSGFLNSLWRWLNQGSNLSILDAVCLMIAIPSTYIIKLVTFARPPKLEKIDQSIFSGSPSKNESVILLGATCGVAVIKYEFNGLKLMYKLVTQGVTGGVSHFTPGAVIEIMSMVIDAWSIYKDLTEPERDEGWAKDVAFVCIVVKACRLAISALNMAAGGVGLSNKAVDEAKEVFDVLAALVVCGLDVGVFVGDMLADGEKGSAAVSAVNTVLDTVSSVGYYVANEFKDKEVATAAVGLAVCQAAAQYGIVTKGVEFRLRYEDL